MIDENHAPDFEKMTEKQKQEYVEWIIEQQDRKLLKNKRNPLPQPHKRKIKPFVRRLRVINSTK